jgi:hypothetical protein
MTRKDTWRDRAACRGEDSDLFFSDHPQDVTEAVNVCRGCPVRDICLADALQTQPVAGVWGGHQFNRSRPQPDDDSKPIAHGTERGARAHRRRGEASCPSCLEAARLAAAHRRPTRAKAAA